MTSTKKLPFVLTLLFAFAGADSFAKASQPLLCVPASDQVLHISTGAQEGVSFPKGAKISAEVSWVLVEVDHPEVRVPIQLMTTGAADSDLRELLADIPPREGAEGKRKFYLEASKDKHKPAFKFEEITDKSTKLSEGDSPVLVYNHGTITNEDVPEKDTRRSRGCYIHPVWGLDGEVITDDFPRDHYHHHGIFWAWPFVEIDGNRYDLWLQKGGIEQRFVRWHYKKTGPVAGVVAVENGWFIGTEKVMTELVEIRVHKAVGDSRAVDITLTIAPTNKPVTLLGAKGKSYGGLTMRFAVKDSKQAITTVPGGVEKEDLKETRLPWGDLTYKFDAKKPSGATVMVHPDHPDFPPTWLTRHYGPMCVGYPGVKSKTFKPGEVISLDYRIWIHRGQVDAKDIQKANDGYKSSVNYGRSPDRNTPLEHLNVLWEMPRPPGPPMPMPMTPGDAPELIPDRDLPPPGPPTYEPGPATYE